MALHAPRAGAETTRQIAFVVVVALIISLAVRTFLVQVYTVPSASMDPSLHVQDRIVVSPLAGLGAPRRGDVVVFADPGGWLPAEPPTSTSLLGRGATGAMRFLGLMAPERRTLVKRVIGIGGDRVVCCDQSGRITVNGVPIVEPYLSPGTAPSLTPFAVSVPPGCLWVMGDNRSVSMDSRAQQVRLANGCVPVALLRGTVQAVAWPPLAARPLTDARAVFAGVPPSAAP